MLQRVMEILNFTPVDNGLRLPSLAFQEEIMLASGMLFSLGERILSNKQWR